MVVIRKRRWAGWWFREPNFYVPNGTTTTKKQPRPILQCDIERDAQNYNN